MKPNKTDIKPVIEALDGDHEDMEAAAVAVTEAAWAAYERKAKFAVVGQVRYSGGYLDADDARAARVGLGPFATRKQAEGAGHSLAYSSATGEQAKWAAVSLWHGTPASWYQDRKKVREKAARALSKDTPPRELRRSYVEEWVNANPGRPLPEHLQGNGWDGLDGFMEWYEEHALQCPSCEGTGNIPL